MQHRFGANLLILIAALVFGCSDAVEEGTADEGGLSGATAGDGKGDGTGQVADADYAKLPDISGSYRFVLTSEVTSQTPDEDPTTSVTRVDGVLDIEQYDGDLVVYLDLCDVILPEVSGRQPSLDAAVVRTAEIPAFNGRLERGTDGTLGLRTDEAAVVFGARLADPLGEALPVDDEDGRLDDVDNDGKPGVTVKVSGFSIYMAVRVVFGLEGAADEAFGTLGGDAVMDTDFSILGDTVPFVNVARSAAESIEETEVLSVSNLFEATPASSTLCP